MVIIARSQPTGYGIITKAQPQDRSEAAPKPPIEDKYHKEATPKSISINAKKNRSL